MALFLMRLCPWRDLLRYAFCGTASPTLLLLFLYKRNG